MIIFINACIEEGFAAMTKMNAVKEVLNVY